MAMAYMAIRILVTGAPFDKEYDETHVGEMLRGFQTPGLKPRRSVLRPRRSVLRPRCSVLKPHCEQTAGTPGLQQERRDFNRSAGTSVPASPYSRIGQSIGF